MRFVGNNGTTHNYGMSFAEIGSTSNNLSTNVIFFINEV